MKLWGLFASCFAIHVLADWMTSYGTPVFAPFSFKNYSLDLVSNLSFGPMAILSVFILLSLRFKEDSKKWILGGWIAFFAFVGSASYGQNKAFGLVGEDTLASLPDLILPTRWYVVKRGAQDPAVETYSVSVWSREKRFIGRYPLMSSLNDRFLLRAVQLPRVRRSLWFNRWPVARVKEQGPETVIEIGNILFRWLKGGALGGWIVRMDRDGNLVSLRRGAFKPE